MDQFTYRDKCLGTMFGGAIGDALGYPVEFMTYSSIVSEYGASGITRHKYNKEGVAEISDDTQMTLFTANGVLFGATRMNMRGILGAELYQYIEGSYVEWYQAQTSTIDYTEPHYNWIRDIKELSYNRAPGTTCMSALNSISHHCIVKNDSKGCGGVMRISPIPAMLCNPQYSFDINYIVRMSAETARITHKHPLGYLPAGLLSYLLAQCFLNDDNPTPFQIVKHLDNGIQLLQKLYPEQVLYIGELQKIIEKAARMVVSTLPDEVAIREIGEGWAADEAFAIAVFCCMRYPTDFERAIVAAVNHSGDSDSTGAITGNIMGAIHGYSKIPNHFLKNLELSWLIKELATDLSTGIPVSEYNANDTKFQRKWLHKYVYAYSDKVPIKNSYLVDRKLRIYAGEYPGDKDNEICRLKVSDPVWNRFSNFYDLTEEGELNPYSQYLNENQEYHRFPIKDCSVPSSTGEVRALLERIIYKASAGEEYGSGYDPSFYEEGRTYIHCWGGVGRTGTIIACFYALQLKDKGLSAEEVYKLAMKKLGESFSRSPKAKKRIAPENETQRQFVRDFIKNEVVVSKSV